MYTVMFGVLFDRCVFEASITALFTSLMVAGEYARKRSTGTGKRIH